MDQLANMHCTRSTDKKLLDISIIEKYIQQIMNWQKIHDNTAIWRRIEFKNFKQTMFFVNAIAYICEQECHHPDVRLGYNYCEITFTTHELNGLSENDFICAAKINKLLS